MAYTNLLQEAETFALSGEIAQANEKFETAVKFFPDKSEVYEKYAFFQYSQGDLQKAEKLFQEAATLSPGNASLYNNLGVIQYHLKKIEQSRENLEKAVSFHPHYTEAMKNLRRSRLDSIQNKIEYAFSNYALGKFHYLTSYLYKLKTEYLLTQNGVTPVASRLNRVTPEEQPDYKKQEVLFLSVFPRVDMAKKAGALAMTGKYRVKLLCLKTSTDILDGFLNQYFEEIITYDNWSELICYLLALKPEVIISRPRDQVAALAIIFSNSPVIFNVYDIVAFGVPRQHQDALVVEAEQFCFENAAGIIHKGRESEIDKYIRPIYEVKAPVLHFYPFCWKKYFVPEVVPKLSDKDGVPRLVYTGIVAPVGSDKKTTGHDQFLPMIESITKQGIYWHIYYNPETGVNDARYSEYFEVSKRNPFFQFHSPLANHELVQEIAKYDYGYMVHDVRGAVYTDAYLDVAMANKIFTYLEAGLPLVVGNTYRAVADFVQQYNIGIVVDHADLSDLAGRLKRIDYPALKSRVFEVREKLSIEKNIYKLSDFLDQAIVYHSQSRNRTR